MAHPRELLCSPPKVGEFTRRLGSAFVTVLALACAPTDTRTTVDFVIARGNEKFLATPWPSDLMVRKGGVNLDAFPNPFNASTLNDLLNLFEHTPGYSGVQTMYFHVDGGVDDATLPATATLSMTSDAMFLVELATLKRIPITHRNYAESTSFLPAGSVAVMPLLGAVTHGPMALVVTSAAHDAAGAPLGPAPEMLALMQCAAIAAPDAPDCRPYQRLVRQLNLDASNVALVSMLSPRNVTDELLAARDVVNAAPQPRVLSFARRADSPSQSYSVYDGTVELLQFQAGTPPYEQLDGISGGFTLDAQGQPVVQRTEVVPFLLTVPTQTQPVRGWPVAINGHGTGGDLESGLGNTDGDTAFALARASTAMISISEPLHRTRAGYRAGQEDVLTFNFFNPLAGRDNWRQSALEKVQLVRLLSSTSLTPEGKAQPAIRFDPVAISYFGHSQGGIVGAIFVGIEDRIAGAFLSGAGAGFGPSLVDKVDPVNIAAVLRLVLLLPDDEVVDVFHPVISLLQMFVDPADPLHFGRLWREHRGHVAHLMATSGLQDTYSPPVVHEGLAGAFGLPIAAPVYKDIEVLDVLGVDVANATVQGNLQTIDGAPLTAALLQYADRGHFAVFEDAGAERALREFFDTLRRGVPRVTHE